MGEKIQKANTLLLKGHDEDAEIAFELQYLLSLSISQRFKLMENKSNEMKKLLYTLGHGKASEIIKRK
jgi:hypothetical protein